MESIVLFYPIGISFVAGFLCLVIPKKGVREGITVGVSGVVMAIALYLFGITRKSPLYWSKSWISPLGVNFSLKCFPFSSMMVLFVSLFALVISVYSLRFMWKNPKSRSFYTLFLWILGASWGVILANNLFVFLLFWGGLAVLLYAFLSLGSYSLATKGIFTIGVADFALILGALFLYKLSGTLNMDGISRISLSGTLPVVTFLLLSAGAIAKVGAIPFHGWIPEASEKISPPAMAFLVGALDKLVGIYFLARVCLDFFDFSAFSVGPTVLMILGSFTIVVSVMMALTSSNMKKIIAYFSISAAGYMMIGMASKNPVGMAGAIFYLLSTTLWTSLLFLVAGAVERQTETTELSSLGGLSRWMPLTFIGCLIGGLSISGVPPFNGFFSKWMIYQGIIKLNMAGGKLWIIWLLVCMFGSVITLASFIRMMHSVFLGGVGTEKVKSTEKESYISANPGRKVSEVPIDMSLPILILAALCVGFGIFAYELPLKVFILPSLPLLPLPYQWIGWWQPGLATILIIVGIIIGLLIYTLSRVKGVRRDISYIGGESPREEMSISGVEFYDTIANFLGIRWLYRASQKGLTDIYAGMLNFARGIAAFLLAVDRVLDYTWRGLAYIVLLAGKGASLAHSGILHTYLGWCLLGLTILLLVFLL